MKGLAALLILAAIALSGCAAAPALVGVAVQTAPVWVPAVEAAATGVTIGVEHAIESERAGK